MPFIAPIVSAISTWWAASAVGSFLASVGITGTMIVTAGLNVAQGLLSAAFMKKPRGGVEIQREFGGTVPRRIACGLVGISGHDVYFNTYGKSNRFAQHVFVLSHYPCDGLSRVALDGEWVTLGAEDADKGFVVTSGERKNRTWIKFYDGRQTTADAYLIANANPDERWSAAHVGIGVCYAIVSSTYHREENNSLPNVFFELRGARLYDWRKDTTAGGSGPHRWNDPTTHEYSENPILMAHHYRRGFAVNGDLFCGMGMAAADLPLAKYTVAANLCDEEVETEEEGVFEPRYACSILLDAGPDTTHGQNLDSVMLSCGAMNIDDVEGSWPIVGSEQPVVATITDDDLVVGAPLTFRATRSMAEIVNSISGNYPDPEQLWSMVGYEQQIDAAGLVLDRRSRDLAIDFPMVRSKRQAEQLASIYLLENRCQASASIVLRPRFQGLKVGDWIEWQSARYGTRIFMVSKRALASLDSDQPRVVSLTLAERDGAIYDGVVSSPIILPVAPGLPELMSEVDFTLAAAVRQGDGGRERPAILVTLAPIDDDTVSEVEISYWPTAQPGAISYYPPFTPDVSVVTLDGVVNDTEYSVATRLRTLPVRVLPWSAPKTVVTPDVRLGSDDLYPIDLPGLGDDVRNFQKWIGGSLRDLQDEYEQLHVRVSDQELANFNDKQTIRQEIVAKTGEITAAYSDAITLAAGPNSALAIRTTVLEALMPGKADAIVLNAQIARIDEIDGDLVAIADQIIGVETTVGNFAASGKFRVTTETTPGDAQARIGLSVAATGGGVTKTAAIFLDAMASGSARAIIDAPNLYFGDISGGATPINPLVYTGGVWRAQSFKIGTAVIDDAAITGTKRQRLEVDRLAA